MNTLFQRALLLMFLAVAIHPGVAQSLDFQNTTYFTASGTDLTSAGETLSAFNFGSASSSHPLFNDGVYYAVQDYTGSNLWVRVRHIAHDPNGTTVGHNVTASQSSPFRVGGFGGWWGFLYQFDVYKDINLTGNRGNKLNGLHKTTVMVESIETLSDTEWVYFEILDDANSDWVLNSISFTGVNPASNPGFSGQKTPYNSGVYSATFPEGANTISVIDFPGGGFSEFSMSANFVSSFTYGYEYVSGGGYQGMRLSFGIAPLLPEITSFTPPTGYVNTPVTIEGLNFAPDAAGNVVKFNGVDAVVISATTTTILTTVPQGATTGPITVTVSGHTATSSTDFVVLVCPQLTPPVVAASARCGPGAITLTATGAGQGQEYRWYETAQGGTPVGRNATYSIELTATRVLYVSKLETASGCESTRAEVTATLVTSCNPVITAVPVVTVIEGNVQLDLRPLITTPGLLDVSSITIVSPPPSGATASVSGGILTLNYAGISFSGKEPITIAACNSLGSCTQQVFTIEVVGDIVVYNGLSPNGDNKNDFLRIQYIEVIPETAKNRVFIYNRWGDRVWEIENYDNGERVFTGLSSAGNELPAGTYYYKIEFPGGRKAQTGSITLKR